MLLIWGSLIGWCRKKHILGLDLNPFFLRSFFYILGLQASSATCSGGSAAGLPIDWTSLRQIFRLGAKLLIFGFRVGASEFETCKLAEGNSTECHTLWKVVTRLLLILWLRIRLRKWIYSAFYFLDHAFGEFKVWALFSLAFKSKINFNI